MGTTLNRSELTQQEVQRILDEICRQLDPAYLDQLIDGPIDRAMLNYTLPAEPVTNCQSLVDRITDFVEHLHREALPLGPQFTGVRARDYAIAMMSAIFSQPEGKGYERGLTLALKCGPDAWVTILQALAETTKTILREQYVRWVHLSLIDPYDEELRCKLCALILDQLRPYVPGPVKEAQIEAWADCLDELVSLYCSIHGPSI